MNSISKRLTAVNILLGLFLMVVVFHALIALGVIPFSIVWGGKLNSKEDMYRFEAVSILINILFIIVLWRKKCAIRKGEAARWISGILWFFMLLFIANTIGNLFAESLLEKVLFTPITFVSAILIYLINRSPG